MKCLLWDFKSNETDEVKNYYLNFHNVDRNNVFFKRLFEDQNNVFHRRRCARCNEFLPTTKFKSYHDFLKHYSSGENVIGEKPLSVTSIGNVTKFEIRYQEHLSHYGFYNFESLVGEFLFNVKTRIRRSYSDFLVRCGFSLENIQPPIDDYDHPLKVSRYWSTNLIQTKLFNEFFFNTRESVLKRVIYNGMSSSLWHFNRSLYINIKTIKVTGQMMK